MATSRSPTPPALNPGHEDHQSRAASRTSSKLFRPSITGRRGASGATLGVHHKPSVLGSGAPAKGLPAESPGLVHDRRRTVRVDSGRSRSSGLSSPYGRSDDLVYQQAIATTAWGCSPHGRGDHLRNGQSHPPATAPFQTTPSAAGDRRPSCGPWLGGNQAIRAPKLSTTALRRRLPVSARPAPAPGQAAATRPLGRVGRRQDRPSARHPQVRASAWFAHVPLGTLAPRWPARPPHMTKLRSSRCGTSGRAGLAPSPRISSDAKNYDAAVRGVEVPLPPPDRG